MPGWRSDAGSARRRDAGPPVAATRLASAPPYPPQLSAPARLDALTRLALKKSSSAHRDATTAGVPIWRPSGRPPAKRRRYRRGRGAPGLPVVIARAAPDLPHKDGVRPGTAPDQQCRNGARSLPKSMAAALRQHSRLRPYRHRRAADDRWRHRRSSSNAAGSDPTFGLVIVAGLGKTALIEILKQAKREVSSGRSCGSRGRCSRKPRRQRCSPRCAAAGFRSRCR